MFSLYFGVFLSSVFFFSSHIIASFYEKEELIGVVRWLSLSLLFQALQVIPKALANKALAFKKIGIITLGVQFFTGSVAIYLAYTGFSFYALVVKSILESFLTLVLFIWLNPIRITLKLTNLEPIRRIAKFSSYQFITSIMNYSSRNLDNIMIGKALSFSDLGYYDKAYRLMMMPITNLTQVISPVILPVLSDYQDDKTKIYNSYVKILRLLSMVAFPLSVFLYYSASDIITILYGTQWGQSVPVFKILSLSVGAQILLSTTGSIFQSLGRTDLFFYSSFLSICSIMVALLVSIFYFGSLEAVGWSITLVFFFNLFQVFYTLIVFGLKKSFIQFILQFSIVVFYLLVSILMSFSVSLVSSNNIFWSFGMKLMGLGASFLIIFLFNKKELMDLKKRMDR